MRCLPRRELLARWHRLVGTAETYRSTLRQNEAKQLVYRAQRTPACAALKRGRRFNGLTGTSNTSAVRVTRIEPGAHRLFGLAEQFGLR